MIQLLTQLAGPRKSSQVEDKSKSQVAGSRPDVRKSLRRVEPPKKTSQTSIKPVEIQMPSPKGKTMLNFIWWWLLNVFKSV